MPKVAKTAVPTAPQKIPQEGAGGIIDDSDVTHWSEDEDQENKVGAEVTFDLGKDKGAKYDYEIEGMGGT